MDPVSQVGHFGPGGRTEAMDLPGPEWQNAKLSAGFMHEGQGGLFWSLLTLKTSEQI